MRYDMTQYFIANILINFVFLSIYQVVDIERDIIKAKAGAGNDLVYKTITGLTANLSVESKPVILEGELKEPKTDTGVGETNSENEYGKQLQQVIQSRM